MRNIWKVGALGAVFGAVLSVGGCQDFDAAYEKCVAEGRCGPDGGSAEGDGGGRDAGPDCIPSSIPDQPDDQGIDSDCDGVDGVADAGYFVDPASGNDTTGDGSRERPFGTLAHALEQVRTGNSGRTAIYLARGTYNEASTEVAVAVSLHGGYARRGTSGDWGRFTDGGTLIDGGPLAFTIRDLPDASVLLDGLHISSNDAPQGQPSIALRAIHLADLFLHNTVVEAGRGGRGTNGSAGDPGAQGAAGEDGGSANTTTGGSRGRGGTSSCSVSGSGAGGGGGRGVTSTAGETGLTGAGGTLGGGGGSAAGFTQTPSTNIYICAGTEGILGGAGQAGDAGFPGDAGTGTGLLNADAGVWEIQPAQSGAPGLAGVIGAGGGGGGSGGACSDPDLDPGQRAGSGAGGGGGSGGCGGMPGGGGSGGGASIALLLIDAHAVVGNNSHLTTRGGGQGGEGGQGGPGGAGGGGGDAGTGANIGPFNKASPAPAGQYTTYGGAGGPGGRGGTGGTGGPGGGGAGGPSVGVWCSLDAGITLEDGGFVTPADGGRGGESSGNPGEQGAQSQYIDCVITDAGTP
ncbi:hypothetical protein OV208_34240 [Corallococcus sp. bb12-1]|uniref:hypothetical protein n=1 Tax=Corallococcus sp. bb12-1 TaxID=2996784 RepID=UPI002271FDD8|nr:hypothetical protein [Corallococcus sp. bb12-1]MCY1046415.1 hypothetical protein [Corallococcus sp. bb12-1]